MWQRLQDSEKSLLHLLVALTRELSLPPPQKRFGTGCIVAESHWCHRSRHGDSSEEGTSKRTRCVLIEPKRLEPKRLPLSCNYRLIGFPMNVGLTANAQTMLLGANKYMAMSV